MSLLKWFDLTLYYRYLKGDYFLMEKKKAIKIATASAIALTGAVAVAPVQPEAASSITSQVSKARATMKKPYDRYVKSTSKLAGVNTVKADIVKAKKAQKDINAAIKKSNLSTAEKNVKYAQVKAYVKYITHAENYVKGYEEGQGKRDQLNALSAELNKAVAAKDIAAIEKQVAELETAIKEVKKYIKDTVYGAAIERLLYNRFTKPSESVLIKGQKALAELTAVSKIESVIALDDTSRFLEITFDGSVTGISAADISFQDADSLERYGVKGVKVSSDGKVATVELYSQEDNNSVLVRNQEYKVTAKVNGKTVEGTYIRADYRKARVTEVNFDDRKINLGSKRLDVPKSVELDFEEAKGRTIKVWFNDKDEVIKYAYDEDETVIYSHLQLDKDDVIKTLNDGKKYDTSDKTFTFLLNDEEKDYPAYRKANIKDAKDPETDFAKVVLGSNGEVEYVLAYNFQDYSVVQSVDKDGEEIVGVTGTSSISDAADYLIIKDGKQVSYEDLKAGDVVLYNADAYDEDGFAVVYNKTVSGNIETVYEESLVVGGKEYDFLRDSYYAGNMADARYLDTDGEYKTVTMDDVEDLQKGGKVTLHLDAKGDVLFITGEIEATVADVAVLTDDVTTDVAFGKYSVQLEALFADKSEKVYNVQLENLDKITVNGIEYDIDDASDRDADEYAPSFVTSGSAVTAIKLTAGNGTVVTLPVAALSKGSLVEFGKDSNGNVDELKVFKSSLTGNEDEAYAVLDTTNATSGDELLESGDSYVVTEDGAKKLKDSTVVFDATKGSTTSFDADDITITTWKDYKGSDINKARVLYDDDNEVTAIVIEKKVSNDNVFEEAVITKVSRNTDGEVVSIEAYVNGKKQTIAADKLDNAAADALAKGDVALLTFDKDNTDLVKAVEIDARAIKGLTVTKVDTGKREVTFDNGVTYKLASNGAVLNGKNNDGITVEAFADLNGETNVTVVLDEATGTFAKYFVYEPAKKAGEVTKTALTTAITEFDAVVEAEYTAESYAAYKAAVDAAKTVQANTSATQAQVDAAVTAVNTAKAGLEVKPEPGTPGVTITSTKAEAANDLAKMLGAVEYNVEGTVADSANVDKVEVSFTNGTDTVSPTPTVTGSTFTATISAGDMAGEFNKVTVKVTYKDGTVKEAEQALTVTVK